MKGNVQYIPPPYKDISYIDLLGQCILRVLWLSLTVLAATRREALP